MLQCAICSTAIEKGAETVRCDHCESTFHRACWDEIGGCATYGCPAAAPSEKTYPTVSPGGGWGENKTCPNCAREIKAGLLLCSGCGALFPYVDPMTSDDYLAYRQTEKARIAARNTLLVLFGLSLFGVTAPVLGPGAGIYAYLKRNLLVGSAGAYLALGYGTAVIGGVYLLLFLWLVLGA